MSLTSVELNYLIWRYLQESGFDLAAYALQKDSACLDYEHAQNKLVPAIEPGCLVNLVQKGILYTFLQDAAAGKESQLTVFDAILKDKADYDAAKASEQAQLLGADKTRENDLKIGGGGGDGVDVAMGDAEDTANGSVEEEIAGSDVPFQTQILTSFVAVSASLLLDWHPSTDVLSLGNENSTAVIYALGPAGIAETVTLSHPPIIIEGVPVPSSISVVSWSPQGTMVLTAGSGGEIRAWAPDGRLKNIVNSVAMAEPVPLAIHALVWNAGGLFVLSINLHNTVSVWEGTTLAHILEFHGDHEDASVGAGVGVGVGVESHACWLSDLKFAMSTRKNAISIFSVNLALPYGENLASVGHLPGHENTITSICFSAVLKLLASASDADYVIKVWNSSLSQDALELNSASEKVAHLHYHTLPIIALKWLSRLGDVQGNELLSVSMEGAVNIWDAFTGDALVSANIFTNPSNFQIPEENGDFNISTKNALVFAAAVSPNSRLLAIGDDSGNVSVWDIYTASYKGTTDFLRCLGIFAATETLEDTSASRIGICDLVWDSKGHFITVCYKGRDSVILKWEKH